MTNNKSIYQIITDKFVEQLSSGIIPWHKPWSLVGNSNEVAISYTTRKPYSLLNQMLLGWRAGEYLTFKQIQDLKGQVKKGAKSSMVVFYTPIKVTEKDEVTGEEIEKTIRCLKYYNVFHINDTIGIDSKISVDETNEVEVNPIESAETLIQGYLEREKTLTFVNDKVSDNAYFSPSQDLVNVPCIKQYKVVEEYYSTTFHELTHSTMTEKRCNRKTNCKFGSELYSKEELVAEIGSAFLCSLSGIDNTKVFTNSVGYIQSWLKALKNDTKLVVIASAQAEKAVKYIANLQD